MDTEFAVRDFEIGKPSSYLAVLKNATLKAREYFLVIPVEDFRPPLYFLIVTHLITNLVILVSGLWGIGFSLQRFVWSFSSGVVSGLLMAGIIHALARYVLRSRISFPATLRVYAYAGGVWALGFVTVVMPPVAKGIFWAVLAVIHLYLMLIGLQQAGRMTMPIAAACLLMSVVTMLLFSALAGMWTV